MTAEDWEQENVPKLVEARCLRRRIVFPEQGKALREWLLCWVSEGWLAERQMKIEDIEQRIQSDDRTPIYFLGNMLSADIKVAQPGVKYSLQPQVDFYSYLNSGHSLAMSQSLDLPA